MKNTKQLGRTIGLLLLVVITTGIPSTLFRGLSTALARTPEFLETILSESTTIPVIVLLSFLASLTWLIITALVFPLMKKYNYGMALLFSALWTICFAISLYGDIAHLSLLSIGKEAAQASTSMNGNFRELGFLKVKDYIWAHFITLILYTSATLIFFYFLFKTKLIPPFLSGWGLLAVSIVFIASWLNIFGISTGEYPFMHNGIHMIVFTIWLTVKGFRESALSTNTP
ncbi:MAG: DUF4386 domain-containing protein [Bacteroidota bacterium]